MKPLILAALALLALVLWSRREPEAVPWPLYREGDDGLLPVDPWLSTGGYRTSAPEWWVRCICPTVTGGMIIHRDNCPMYVPLGLTFGEPVRR